MPRKPIPAASRFERYVDRSVNDCWLWTGGKTAAGYGNFKVRSDVMQLAHRWSYEHHVGPIPEGPQLDHLCRTPACVNPGHLEPVTSAENTRRGLVLRTECSRGHTDNSENTRYYTVPGTTWRARACRVCQRENGRCPASPEKARPHLRPPRLATHREFPCSRPVPARRGAQLRGVAGEGDEAKNGTGSILTGGPVPPPHLKRSARLNRREAGAGHQREKDSQWTGCCSGRSSCKS
jgi:hypothetical protein